MRAAAALPGRPLAVALLPTGRRLPAYSATPQSGADVQSKTEHSSRKPKLLCRAYGHDGFAAAKSRGRFSALSTWLGMGGVSRCQPRRVGFAE